jgi:hypothetical protein
MNKELLLDARYWMLNRYCCIEHPASSIHHPLTCRLNYLGTTLMISFLDGVG